MTFTKIQVIKILRDQIPGLGLSDAKDIVDSYEVKDFENRVARALGEEARNELRQWALLYNGKREDAFNAMILPHEEDKSSEVEGQRYEFPSYEEYEESEYDDGICYCEDCMLDREKQKKERKLNSQSWCDITGIEIFDPDGWDRKNYEASWSTPITREEFLERAGRSTCKRWPDPLLDDWKM